MEVYSFLTWSQFFSGIVPRITSTDWYLNMKRLTEGIVPHIVPVFFGIRFEDRIPSVLIRSRGSSRWL